MSNVLLGNKQVNERVRQMVSSRHIPHAIIIEGAGGTGKKTVANYITKAVVCSGENIPCNSCKACHLVDGGGHPDVLTISPENGRTIKVDAVRNLREEAYLTPLMAEGRVFIFIKAETMNANAQNALLKVLEEPPSGVVFILLTENSSLLLETVRSRCILLSLTPPAIDESADYVAKKAECEEEKAREALEKVGGNIGLALQELEGMTNDIPVLAQKLMVAARKGSELDILRLLQPLSKDRGAVKQLVAALKEQTVAMLVSKAKGIDNEFSSSRLYALHSALEEYERDLVYNPSLPLLFCCISCSLIGK